MTRVTKRRKRQPAARHKAGASAQRRRAELVRVWLKFGLDGPLRSSTPFGLAIASLGRAIRTVRELDPVLTAALVEALDQVLQQIESPRRRLGRAESLRIYNAERQRRPREIMARFTELLIETPHRFPRRGWRKWFASKIAQERAEKLDAVALVITRALHQPSSQPMSPLADAGKLDTR